MPGWDCPARPAVYKAPIGAQVASPQSPTLRWSTSRISALTLRTRGAKQKSGFARTSGFANYSCPVLLAPQQLLLLLLQATPEQLAAIEGFLGGQALPGRLKETSAAAPLAPQ